MVQQFQGICQENWKHVHTKTCAWMFIATWFTVAKRWKQYRCSSPDEWISELQCVHAVEYHAAMKRNEVGIRVMTWLHPENMLRERSRTQKLMVYMILFICSVFKRQICGERRWVGGCQRLVMSGEREWLPMGTGFLLRVLKIFVDSCTMLRMH